MNQKIILIVGMARSGTTLVSHILGSMPDVHIEVEPHALWKSGNFLHLSDEEYKVNNSIASHIRNKIVNAARGKNIVEKSPINCLRPQLVHAVFPDAKIVYIERDAVRCINSNYKRSLKNDSFKPSITLKKYFIYTGTKDLDGAISNRKLFQQIRFSDILPFTIYSFYMLWQRQVKKCLPFGPKVKNFAAITKEKGLLYFHTLVYKKSLLYKKEYQALYAKQMEVFSMEKIMNDPLETERLIAFTGLPCPPGTIEKILLTLDKERVEAAVQKSAVDDEIRSLLSSIEIND